MSTNNIDKCINVLLDVIKNIFCYEIDNDKRDSLCHLIDINNLPSLKIIEPDGNFIKKDQILELQNHFSKSSIYTKEQIYIVKDAERMNKESANTMLKFLEEPTDNIIGFFITNHKNNIMPTIISRCQIIEVLFNEDENYLDKEEHYNIAIKYINALEVEKKELILYNKEYLSDLEKEDIKIIMKILLNIYVNVLNNNIYDNNCNFLKELSKNNIIKKIKLLENTLNRLNYNINLDLLLDSFIIEMDGINNETL